MLIEAMRLRLLKQGVLEAEDWSPEQVMEHVDSVMTKCSTGDPEHFPEMIQDFFTHVKGTMLVVNDVLQEEPLH